MFKKSFKGKIIFASGMIKVVLVAILILFLYSRFMAYSNAQVELRLDSGTNSLNAFLDSRTFRTKVAAGSMAIDGNALHYLSEQDMNGLVRLFSSMEDLYQVSFFTITDPEGNVLARTNDPSTVGDSVLDSPEIANAKLGVSSSFYTTGPYSKVMISSGSPVFDSNQNLIGMISASIQLDSASTVNDLKTRYNFEATIFYGDNRVVTTLMTQDGHSMAGTTLDPSIADVVFNQKQPYTGQTKIEGTNYSAYYKPLLDSKGDAFAAVFIGLTMAPLESAMYSATVSIVIMSIIGILVAVFILYLIVSTVSRPLNQFTHEMESFSRGDLDIEIVSKGEDEVGHLSQSLRKAVDTLKQLIKGIIDMIAEQEQGNTEYKFNIDDFEGDYRVLAEKIIELSNAGMVDKLTSLPNRRSFDSRLNLEWGHAIREKAVTSLLMMDIDHFKLYNDTYGHQQGDLVIQTVANVLKEVVKRKTDFAARWGGEEFLVLLPGTDTGGAVKVGETIRTTLEKERIPMPNGEITQVTTSIGVYSLIPKEVDSPIAFIEKADEALYQAKEGGRNQVCVYRETKPEETTQSDQ